MRRPPAFGYQNAVLSAIAVLLALGLIDRHSGGELTSMSLAIAQEQPEQGGMTNDLAQRQIIIAELRQLNAKMDRLDARLVAGVNVKVTSMPPIQVNNPEGKPKPKPSDEAQAPKPAPSK